MSILRPSFKEVLIHTMWAKSLTPAQMARVEADMIERDIPAGGYACRKGEPVEHWMGVTDGLLKMSSMSPEGKTVTFTGMLAGGWFGEGSLLKDEARQYDLVSVRETRLALLNLSLIHI